MFALCRSCCEEMRQDDCNHENPKDREFTGTWVVNELRKAVELGYIVREIYIVWQYETTRFDGQSGGLFANYVNTFLKIKQESSGWPSWCKDDESKNRYLLEYERDEGIKLDPTKIEQNAGLRAVAKLCLNSFWGKFGQRSNLKQTDIVKTREALLKLLHSPDKEVLSILPVNDNVLYVSWQFREEAVAAPANTNVAIAAYVTCQARLELYKHLEKLGTRILYCDTDSCIFVKRDENEYEPALGNLLGEMTDELRCYGEGAYIDSMIAVAPKFYAFRAVCDGQTVDCCKVRGVTLNFKNAQQINFDSIKSLLEKTFESRNRPVDERDKRIVLEYDSIRRTATHDIVTRSEFKSCIAVLKKRRYLTEGVSLPFGFKTE